MYMIYIGRFIRLQCIRLCKSSHSMNMICLKNVVSMYKRLLDSLFIRISQKGYLIIIDTYQTSKSFN